METEETITVEELGKHTPFWLRPDGSPPLALWLEMQQQPLDEPFFNDSVRRYRRRRDAAAPRLTPLEALQDLAEASPGLAPNGFIFHMSRCGSTALSRALARSPDHLVVSEADPVNQLLAPCEATRKRWLPHLISVLGRRRRGTESAYFVKLSSWNILQLPLWRQLFPDTPWIFVYRHPVPVMVSILERPTGWLAQPDGPWGAPLIADPEAPLDALPKAELAARALGHFCHLALQGDGRRLLVDHRDLGRQSFARMLRHCGVEPRPALLRSMVEASGYYSKSQGAAEVYYDDSAAKIERASRDIHRAAETWALPAYYRLGCHQS